jgi:hypothetical protein
MLLSAVVVVVVIVLERGRVASEVVLRGKIVAVMLAMAW